jgi:hypothetical protein
LRIKLASRKDAKLAKEGCELKRITSDPGLDLLGVLSVLSESRLWRDERARDSFFLNFEFQTEGIP